MPSTEGSRAASRVNGWRSGRYAKVVTAAEVVEQRRSMIESGRLGTDADREQIREFQRLIEACGEHQVSRRMKLRMELTRLVASIGRKPQMDQESER